MSWLWPTCDLQRVAPNSQLGASPSRIEAFSPGSTTTGRQPPATKRPLDRSPPVCEKSANVHERRLRELGEVGEGEEGEGAKGAFEGCAVGARVEVDRPPDGVDVGYSSVEKRALSLRRWAMLNVSCTRTGEKGEGISELAVLRPVRLCGPP